MPSASYLKNKYGLSLEEYDSLLESTNKSCWMCGRKEGRLCIDHVHVPGYKKMPAEEKKKYVRSILCFLCNTSLHGIEKRKNARFYLDRINAYFTIFPIKGEI